MISLKKYLIGPWERVRQTLIEDLESIESAVNMNWGSVFTPNNVVKMSSLDVTAISEALPPTPTGAGEKLYLHSHFGGL